MEVIHGKIKQIEKIKMIQNTNALIYFTKKANIIGKTY